MMVLATMGELAAPEHPVALHKWAVSHGAGGFFSTFKLWGVEPHGAALEAWCAGTEQRRGMLAGYLGDFPMGLATFAHQHMGFSLAALHWLWVPLRGSCPAGGNRQWLRFPAGAFQPSAQLPQPRVLPREADVERGESGRRRADGLDGATSFTPGFGLAWEKQLLKGDFFFFNFLIFFFFAIFPPNAEIDVDTCRWGPLSHPCIVSIQSTWMQGALLWVWGCKGEGGAGDFCRPQTPSAQIQAHPTPCSQTGVMLPHSSFCTPRGTLGPPWCCRGTKSLPGLSVTGNSIQVKQELFKS